VSIDFHNKLITKGKLKAIYIISAVILTYFASWLPDFQNVIGIEGARISSVAAFGPLNGMLLGPYWGAAVSFTGVMAHVLIEHRAVADNTFLLISPLFVMLSSIVAGLAITRKRKAALLVYSSLIVMWYLFDTGREAYYQPWFHIVILVAFVIFHNKFQHRLMHANVYTFISLFLTSLIAILSDHMAGNITALIVFDLPASVFSSVLFIYPVERTILALAASFIMFMVVAAIQYTIMNTDIIDEEIKRARADSLLSYVQNDVKKVLEQEKSGKGR